MEKEILHLYHAGYEEIKHPDIRAGRANADFGQGFYMTDNGTFAGKWMRERKGASIFINEYELCTTGLTIQRLERDESWYDYIFRNRSGAKDLYEGIDILIGPIACDTIYDTLGIFTSGFLSREQAAKLMKIGPLYEQIVVKTEKAASALKWISSRMPGHEEAARFRQQVTEEEKEYQRAIALALEAM